jgi:SNF2 family DNA or RNA helicase
MVQWLDKPEALDAVTDLIKDITIRYKFEDCIDIPEHIKTFTTLEPPAWLMKKYLEFKEFSVLETENGEELSAIHAGAKVKKLLQLLSGAVYDQEGKALKVHDARYNLVLDLIEERDQCVVAYNWKHELEQLTRIASNRNIKYACINGEVKNSDRTKHVKAFQKGELKVIFAHPQSAGHGLTLTAGTTTIWCSPTYNAEHYEQFNRRIYRAGQTRKTETIRIAYADTEEIGVYEKLDTKLERLEELLTLFHTMTKIRKNT